MLEGAPDTQKVPDTVLHKHHLTREELSAFGQTNVEKECAETSDLLLAIKHYHGGPSVMKSICSNPQLLSAFAAHQDRITNQCIPLISRTQDPAVMVFEELSEKTIRDTESPVAQAMMKDVVEVSNRRAVSPAASDEELQKLLQRDPTGNLLRILLSPSIRLHAHAYAHGFLDRIRSGRSNRHNFRNDMMKEIAHLTQMKKAGTPMNEDYLQMYLDRWREQSIADWNDRQKYMADQIQKAGPFAVLLLGGGHFSDSVENNYIPMDSIVTQRNILVVDPPENRVLTPLKSKGTDLVFNERTATTAQLQLLLKAQLPK